MSREGDSKSFRFPNLLYSKLSVLAGDVAQNIDFAPNNQQREVHELLKTRMLTYQDELDMLINQDVGEFNNLLKEKNIPEIFIPGRN